MKLLSDIYRYQTTDYSSSKPGSFSGLKRKTQYLSDLQTTDDMATASEQEEAVLLEVSDEAFDIAEKYGEHDVKTESVVAEEPAGEQAAAGEATAENEAAQAQDDLAQKRLEERERMEEEMAQLSENQQAGGMGMSSSKPADNSAALTKRLVAATIQFEVRQVIADANKDLISLRIAAGMSKGEDAEAIRRIIKKLEKLVTRSHRKINDLTEEEGLQQKAREAERRKEEARAAEIKAELRKRLRERREREKKYLREAEQDQMSNPMQQSTPGAPTQKLDAATEAQIAAQAEAQAAVEASVGGGSVEIGGVEAGTSGGEASSSGGGEVSGGGEAAAAEGGGASAE